MSTPGMDGSFLEPLKAMVEAADQRDAHRTYIEPLREARRAGAVTVSGSIPPRDITAEDLEALGVEWVPVDPPAA